MPLPPLHSLAGYTIYRSIHKTRDDQSWKWAALAVLLANLADFDFLPGIFARQIGRFHRGITHSIGMAIIVGLLIGWLARLWKKDSFGRAALFSFGAYVSHIFLDFFSEAKSQIAILWPFSSARFDSPIYFGTIREDPLKLSGSLGEFLASMWNPGFLRMVLDEAALVFMIWTAASLVSAIGTNLSQTRNLAKSVTVESP